MLLLQLFLMEQLIGTLLHKKLHLNKLLQKTLDSLITQKLPRH